MNRSGRRDRAALRRRDETVERASVSEQCRKTSDHLLAVQRRLMADLSPVERAIIKQRYGCGTHAVGPNEHGLLVEKRPS